MNSKIQVLLFLFLKTMIQSKRWELGGLKKCSEWKTKYDSLLERNYMYELEQMGWVKSWTKNHNIEIPYFIFGILKRKYLPDFLVTYMDGSQEVHETKWAWFLSWASTHAKRLAGDKWCKERGMIYRFIENSNGAMFAYNNELDRMQNFATKEKVHSLDHL